MVTLKVYSIPACSPEIVRLSPSCDVFGWRTPLLYTLTTSVGSLGSARLSFTPAQHVEMAFGSRGVGSDVMLGAPAGQYNHLKNTITVSHQKHIYRNTLTWYKEHVGKGLTPSNAVLSHNRGIVEDLVRKTVSFGHKRNNTF